MNMPVSFKLTKLLKEKEFDEQLNYYYDSFGDIGSSLIKLNWNKSEELLHSAPTIAEVVMWLYEKYGIWIEVQCPDIPTELWSFNIHRFQKYGGYGDGNNFNSQNKPTKQLLNTH